MSDENYLQLVTEFDEMPEDDFDDYAVLDDPEVDGMYEEIHEEEMEELASNLGQGV